MFFNINNFITDGLVEFILFFDKFIFVYLIFINLGLFGLYVFSARSLWNFIKSIIASDYERIRKSDLTLPISLLVPAFNEQRTIVDTVKSLLNINYGEFEIIVINDGSTDNTLVELIQEYQLEIRSEPICLRLATKPIKAIYRSVKYPNLVVLDKDNGGKPDALNAGLNISRYPLFGSIDADSIIEKDALLRLVRPFIEYPEETIAAGGIVRVANGCQIKNGDVLDVRLPKSRMAVMQVIEYIRAFLAARAGWSAANSLLIISGAFGLYNKREVISVGGYSDATVTEDAEIVVRLHRSLKKQKRKYRIVFVPDPVCWTEVPEKFSSLAAQRSRWHRGLLQTLWLNRDMIFRKRYGSIGLFAMPWYLMFELLAPVVELLGYVVIPLSWLFGILNGEYVFLFIFISFFCGTLLSIAAVTLEEISFKRYTRWRDLFRLVLYCFIENIGFRQYLTFIKVKALMGVYWNCRHWGKIERIGFGNNQVRKTIQGEY